MPTLCGLLRRTKGLFISEALNNINAKNLKGIIQRFCSAALRILFLCGGNGTKQVYNLCRLQGYNLADGYKISLVENVGAGAVQLVFRYL